MVNHPGSYKGSQRFVWARYIAEQFAGEIILSRTNFLGKSPHIENFAIVGKMNISTIGKCKFQ